MFVEQQCLQQQSNSELNIWKKFKICGKMNRVTDSCQIRLLTLINKQLV